MQLTRTRCSKSILMLLWTLDDWRRVVRKVAMGTICSREDVKDCCFCALKGSNSFKYKLSRTEHGLSFNDSITTRVDPQACIIYPLDTKALGQDIRDTEPPVRTF